MPQATSFPRAKPDLIGAHVSTQGGICTAFERATKIGASAMALFSKNSNQWKGKELTDEECGAFRSGWQGSGVASVITHASYLINLAGVDEVLHPKSVAAMIDELTRAERIGASAVVLHPGAHLGRGVREGIDGIARSLDAIHEATPGFRVLTLLETAAGQGSCLGCSFEELGRMLALVDDSSRVAVCFDTCHVFSAGYELRTRAGYERTIEELDHFVGLEKVAAFHLNDSKRDLGSRVDRHEHIGQGFLGLEPFRFILNDARFSSIPKVIETPKPDPFEDDIRNLGLLRSLVETGVTPQPRARRRAATTSLPKVTSAAPN